ncbi:hypothetical protein CmeUKMEL1_00810 [Cryptosporidium meleagridis]|uniref:Uncharacterized protein n=1 Tax=Cryptosporidium meleagridis TaxID=93969 RepID=A0A2P4YWC1_9CRYT|nr:hypothetical protein CmeUKMEL1_00810 [Cryptosporidium meleagridis]
MDDLKTVVLRQNEILKKLEAALSNAINRIESIERLYCNSENNSVANNLLFLPKETEHGLIKNSSCKSENLNKEIGNFDLNAVNSAFKLFPIDFLKMDFNDHPINLIENNNDKNSHFIKNVNSNKSVENSNLYNSATNKDYDRQRLEELSENMFDNKSTNITSKLPELEINIKHENQEQEIFWKDKENYFNASNKNCKLQTCICENELKSEYKEFFPNETLNFIANKIDMFNMFKGNKNQILSNCIGKNPLNTTSSNKLYIFDEEDNSSVRLDDPLDLEIAENEFYYLKGHVKRSSSTDNCHLFNCLYPKTREIKNTCDNIDKLGVYSSNRLTPVDNTYLIREIKYHKPYEKIVGYVQIPYNAFLSRYFESSDNGKIKSKTRLKEANYLDSHNIYKKIRNSYEEHNIFSSNIYHYNRQIAHIKVNYPIFYQFFCLQRYPILILRPLFSN